MAPFYFAQLFLWVMCVYSTCLHGTLFLGAFSAK